MEIDPRLFENNATNDPQGWLPNRLTVIFDVWITEYLKDPELADGLLRQHGLVKMADRLVEMFGECWWDRAENPSVGAISQALRGHDAQRESAQ